MKRGDKAPLVTLASVSLVDDSPHEVFLDDQHEGLIQALPKHMQCKVSNALYNAGVTVAALYAMDTRERGKYLRNLRGMGERSAAAVQAAMQPASPGVLRTLETLEVQLTMMLTQVRKALRVPK